MDKYQKVKKIGEGSFGKALLVRHKENGKQFVIKEINMSKMGKKERDDARKETAVLAQLQHPNIVTYKESFEEIGNLYIVMDYCDAGDLYGRINSQRGVLIQEEQIIDWFVQTCLAIKHIHDRKILHRDIKSQNIFLTRHGIVKLGDFGISKVLNSTVELARTCIGTPYYLSPEICENKPYNNKSDIWSLGCVLYELTTLKHAFEAGNMKNLVLKIIRGSYPPPAPRYSYELRSLINQLFKRNPRDRPSINTVLRKPLLTSRIKKFLSESEMAEEFSHTVMHGVKLKKVLPPGGGRPLPPKPVVAKVSSRPPSAAIHGRYDPALVYGQPMARKSKDAVRKSAGEVRKSAGDVRRSGGAKRPPSSGDRAAANSELARRRQELLERERRRKEEEKKKDDQYARAHKDLVEKQRQARLNKAREEGWRNFIDSCSSNDSERRVANKGPGPKFHKPKRSPYEPVRKSFEKKAAAAAPKPDPKPAAGGRGKYDDYNSYIDKLAADRKRPEVPAATPISARDRPVSARDRAAGDAPGVGAFDPVGAAMRGQEAGYRGAQAAEKARVISEFQRKSEEKLSYVEQEQKRLLNDFHARKRQAAAYKARGQGDLFGVGARAAVNPTPYKAPTPKPSEGAPKPSARPAPRPSEPSRPQSARDSGNAKARPAARPLSAREREEQEYLARLKQIRLQNFNDRRQAKDGHASPKPMDPKNDPEVRKRKIEALRAQADERARKLKADLERKRLEAYDKEKRLLQQAKVRAKPAVPITQALNAIGANNEPRRVQPAAKPDKCPVGMTAAMDAIGVSMSVEEEKQKQKEQILKRLNAKASLDDKPPVAEKPEVPDTEDKQERPRWGQPAKEPVIAMERPKWGGNGRADTLAQLSLEDTASNMEATQAGAAEAAQEEEEALTERKHWGAKPSSTVVNALHNVGLSETMASDSSVTSEASAASGPSVTSAPSAIGSTITISKPSDLKAPAIGSTVTIVKKPGGGTVVIRKQDEGDGTAAGKEGYLEEKEKDTTVEAQSKEEASKDISPETEAKSPRDGHKSVRTESTEPESDAHADIPTSDKSKDASPTASPKSLNPKPIGPKPTLSPKPNSSKPDSPKAGSPKGLSPRSVSSKPALLNPKPVDHKPDEKPKTPPKSQKVYEPEIKVEIKDLKDDSPLFSKVELEETVEHGDGDADMALEDVNSGDEASPRDPMSGTRMKENLLLGLTTGNFDIADVKMLRTCSEPDLAKLFRTNVMENPFMADEGEVAASVSVLPMQDDDEEEEEEEAEEGDEEVAVMASYQKIVNHDSADDQDDDEVGDIAFSVKDIAELIGSDDDEEDEKDGEDGKASGDTQDDEDEEDDSEDDDESDEADMETLRQSMMSILNQSSVSDDEAVTKKKKRTAKANKARRRRREKQEEQQRELAKRQDSESSEASSTGRAWSARSVEDFHTMRDNMKSIVESVQAKPKLTPVKEVTDKSAAGDASAVAELPTLNPDTEAWQSDEEQDDDYWEEEDMFSRLEATRENLEQELGCDVFMKAYKTVQAIHEDEDEKMEEGLQLVTEILGPGKAHLYPSILQLVMADGVWTEDND